MGTPLGAKNALGCQIATPATDLLKNKFFCVLGAYTDGARALLVTLDFFDSSPVLRRRVGTAYCQNKVKGKDKDKVMLMRMMGGRGSPFLYIYKLPIDRQRGRYDNLNLNLNHGWGAPLFL